MGEPVGLIAGHGRLPIELAASARCSGRRVVAIALEGLADDGLDEVVDVCAPLPLGQIERLLARLREEGVRQVVLAGKVPKRLLFAGPGRLVPDSRALALLSSVSDRSDDSILRAVARTLEGEGFELLPQAALAPGLLAGEGVLGAVAPAPEQLADLAFGWPIAKALGDLDVGQAVVVEGRAVLALEAIEGTDEAIRRGCALGRGGASVVKVAKPRQDPRFDVPAIGADTVRALAEGRGRMIAVEADRTFLLEREATLRVADAAGIAIIGVHAARMPRGAA